MDGDESASRADGCRDGVDTRYTTWQSSSDDPGMTLTPDESTSCCRHDSSPNGSNGSRGTNLTICKEHSESGAGHQHDHHHVRENGKTQKMQAGDAQEEVSRDNGLSRVETKIHGHGHAHGHSYSCQQSEALVDTSGASGSISQSTTSKDGQQVHASAKETPVATQESPCTHDHAHGHAHGHSHSHHDKDPDVPAPTVCLAVIQENGMDVVLLDATGVPRVFRYPGVDVRQLCFDPHGSADGSLLTPCLDQEGKHGVPEDSCFCGVETPHMHAHLKAAACDDACADPTQLATHTLYPNQETTPTKSKHVQSTNPVLNIQVSERMPKECNSTAIQSQHSSHGRWRRVHPVQHEDHVDFLVHDTVSGDLHLEHPCHGCGGDDVHGRFERVGQRHWRNVTVQFFQVASAKFNIQDFRNIFSVESDRVKAVENLMDAGTSRNQRNSPFFVTTLPQATSLAMARSVIACSQICCASEIPIINNILEPMAGVSRVRVNVPLKQVLIDHDAKIVPAATMERALNKQGLGASILRDGTFTTAATSKPKTTGASVKSTFYVAHICCASEIPAINQVVEPLSGVLAVSINVTSKMVYVTHDTTSIAASQICAVLNEQGFGAEVKSDGGENFIGSLFCESTLAFQMDDSGPKNYTTILTSFLREYFDPSQIQMESFVLNVPQQQIKVVHNPFSVSASSIAETLQAKTGIRATVLQDGAAPSSFDWSTSDFLDNVSVDNAEEESVNYPKPAITLSGICWLLSMLSLLGGQLDILKYVGLAAVAFGLPTISGKAFRTLSRWQFDTNCLMFLAAMGAVVLQEYTEAAAVVFLFAISEWLEVRATARARHALSAIVHLRPEKANLVHPQTRQLVVIPASAVPVGALVSVKTGDKIPCDGIVVEGTTTVDESSLTGEARPIRKGLHDVVSGDHGANDIDLGKLGRVSFDSAGRGSSSQSIGHGKLVDEFAKIYTPFVVLAAVLMCSVPWAFGQETGRTWTENGLILIVVACPCAMIISTPVSYVAGLAATAQNGILIKGGAHLEALSLVKHICFDKTGTLTNGEFALLSLEDFAKNMSRKEVFEHLALMEERASHPVAQAILTGARNEKVSIPKDTELERHTIVAGEGVLGIINGREVHVGNERMFGRIGLLKDVPETVRAKVESWKGLGGTIGYMSIEGEGIVCAYCAADGVRAESASVLSRLRKCGIEVTMLTGDNRDAALAVGAQVGLSEQEIQSKLLPEEKLAFVESLSSGRTGGSILSNPCGQRRLVMMCGDGVNDAPALAAADIGVAMGAGAALAMETADVTLLDSNLEKLEYSIKMGQKVIRKIKENVIFSLTVKAVVLAFAAVGKAYLWAAIGSDVGAMILVTLNAMLLLPRRQGRADITKLQDDIENGNNKVRSSTTLVYGSMEDGDEQKPFVFEWARSARACSKECCSEPTQSKGAGAINKTDVLDTDKPCESSKMADVKKVLGVGITRCLRKAHSRSIPYAEQHSVCHPDQGMDALESDALLPARP